MTETSSLELIKNNLLIAFLFGVLFLIGLQIAKKKGFFYLQPPLKAKQIPVQFTDVIFVFGLYLSISLAFPFLIRPFLSKIYFTSGHELTWQYVIHFITMTMIAGALLLYCIHFRFPVFHFIWKNIKAPSSYIQDIFLGVTIWFLSFPLVISVSHFMEAVVYMIFPKPNLADQTAIKYLQQSQDHPVFLLLSLITILIFAPIIEELLFRGFLQTWLKKYLKRKTAIILASLAFAFFHFNPLQQQGNIPLISTLFCLSCILGFLYERQRSLLSPITLHAVFNMVNIFNLLVLQKLQ